MRRITYEDRAQIYESTLHRLELEDKLDSFLRLLSIAKPGFPTRISRRSAMQLVDNDVLHWLGDLNILKVGENGEYGLIDELLRVRILKVVDRERVGSLGGNRTKALQNGSLRMIEVGQTQHVLGFATVRFMFRWHGRGLSNRRSMICPVFAFLSETPFLRHFVIHVGFQAM
jgi:hypothetical protein